jgi:hypothetical protein
LSIVQGPFSVAPCQTLISRFATFASPYHGVAAAAPGVVPAAAGVAGALLTNIDIAFCCCCSLACVLTQPVSARLATTQREPTRKEEEGPPYLFLVLDRLDLLLFGFFSSRLVFLLHPSHLFLLLHPRVTPPSRHAQRCEPRLFELGLGREIAHAAASPRPPNPFATIVALPKATRTPSPAPKREPSWSR